MSDDKELTDMPPVGPFDENLIPSPSEFQPTEPDSDEDTHDEPVIEETSSDESTSSEPVSTESPVPLLESMEVDEVQFESESSSEDEMQDESEPSTEDEVPEEDEVKAGVESSLEDGPAKVSDSEARILTMEPDEPETATKAPASTPAKKSNKTLIVGLLLLLIAIGCGVAAVLMVTVFKPKGGSVDSDGSGNTGENTSKYANLPSTIDSCPGCVFAYPEHAIVYNPDYDSSPYEAVEVNRYKYDWREVVEESGHEVFLGFTLDSDNMPLKMYACGIANSDKPYCLEGNLSDKYGGNQATRLEAYKKNVNTLNTAFSKTTSNFDFASGTEYEVAIDGSQAVTYFDGSTMQGGVAAYDSDWVFCTVSNYGTGYCNEYWTK